MEELCTGLCACWLLPLGVLGGLVLVWNAVVVAWRHRGLEKGTLYCSSCRFNLRGCASWNCPECGAHLDDGRIMTPGHEPPLGLGARLVLWTVGVAGPLVFGCFLLATLMPFNYETDRRLALTPMVLRPGVDGEVRVARNVDIEVTGRNEVSWWGRGTPESVRFSFSSRTWQMGSRTVRERFSTPLAASDAELVSDALWERVVERCGLSGEPAAWLDELRASLVLALRYVANEVPGDRPRFTRMRVTERVDRDFEPAAWFVMVEVVLAGLVWLVLMRAVVRQYDRVVVAHAGRHARLVERLGAWIAENRELAGLDRPRGGGGD